MSENITAIGRPTVLDAFQRGRVCGIVALGASPREIAKLLQVHPSTIARTAESDEKFAAELSESEAHCCLRPMRAMYFAMEKHWRAAAWMLERMHPSDFGRRTGETFSRRDVREVVDRLLECVAAKVPGEADREEQRLAADRLYEEVGKRRNPLVEMEEQFAELRKYQHEQKERPGASAQT